jgi:ribosome-associated translation inhibitor RaiA
MSVNVQITFRDFSPPQLAEERIRERFSRLEAIYPSITACRVIAEAPHRQHKKGNLYSVHIELMVPGGEVAVNREHNDKHAHEDFFVAMRDAFNAAERQLRERSQRIQGKVKTHGPDRDRP